MKEGAVAYLKLTRKFSAAVVVAGLSYLGAGIASLLLRLYPIHMHLMGMGVLSFAAGVNISFWTSVTREKGSNAAALFHAISLILLPFCSLLGWGSIAVSVAAISGLLFLIPLRRRSLTFLLEIYSFLALLMAALRPGSLEVWITGLEWGYAVPLIYAVTLHSLPRTYRYRPHVPSAALMLVLHLMALVGVGPTKHLMWASMLVYLAAARVDRALSGLRAIRVREALPAHRYLISCYLLLIPLLLISWPLDLDPLGILHILMLGFIGLHVYAHAPMMIPVLLGMRNSKRFNYWAPVLLAMAALAWPFSGNVALFLLLGSLYLVIYIVWP